MASQQNSDVDTPLEETIRFGNFPGPISQVPHVVFPAAPDESGPEFPAEPVPAPGLNHLAEWIHARHLGILHRPSDGCEICFTWQMHVRDAQARSLEFLIHGTVLTQPYPFQRSVPLEESMAKAIRGQRRSEKPAASQIIEELRDMERLVQKSSEEAARFYDELVRDKAFYDQVNSQKEFATGRLRAKTEEQKATINRLVEELKEERRKKHAHHRPLLFTEKLHRDYARSVARKRERGVSSGTHGRGVADEEDENRDGDVEMVSTQIKNFGF